MKKKLIIPMAGVIVGSALSVAYLVRADSHCVTVMPNGECKAYVSCHEGTQWDGQNCVKTEEEPAPAVQQTAEPKKPVQKAEPTYIPKPPSGCYE